MPRTDGRPPILDESLIEEFRKNISVLLYLSDAAAYLGISNETVRDWMRRGERALRKANRRKRAIPKKERIYAEFSAAMKKALAATKGRFLAGIEEAGAGDKAAGIRGNWTARAWQLERRWPEQFGQNRTDAALLRKEIAELKKLVLARQQDADDGSAGPHAGEAAAAGGEGRTPARRPARQVRGRPRGVRPRGAGEGADAGPGGDRAVAAEAAAPDAGAERA